MQEDIKKAIVTEILLTLGLVLANKFIIPIPLFIQLLPIGYPIATSLLFKGIIKVIQIIDEQRLKTTTHEKPITYEPPKYIRQRTYKKTPYYTNQKKYVRQRTRQ